MPPATTIQSNLKPAGQAPPPDIIPSPNRQIEYLDTVQAYDQWAEVGYAFFPATYPNEEIQIMD
jgi:hypothetical protein